MKRQLPFTGAKRCLFLGRQEDPELKGIGVAAEMLTLLATDPRFVGTSSLKLIIRGVDPAQSDHSIYELCKTHGIPFHQIVPRSFTTDAHELQDDLKSCSLLVMPSRVEGFGLVALEAISAGIPILVGQNSGVVQLLTNLDRENSGRLAGWKARVLPVGIDDKINGRIWAEAVHEVLENRDAAFREASDFRAQLQPILTWPLAAAALSKRFETWLLGC